MHKEQFSAKWPQLRGRVKAEWGKLTDDELDQIEGNYDMLVGKIQEKYGQAREQIERRLDSFITEESLVTTGAAPTTAEHKGAEVKAPAGKTK